MAPLLVGKAVPEVPHANASLGITWQPVRPIRLVARARGAASQYDDDQNLLPLASFMVVDASLRFALSARAEFFLSVENLGNSRVETAHSALGVFNLAPPRTAGGGLHLRW